jgi:hypothetical protein
MSTSTDKIIASSLKRVSANANFASQAKKRKKTAKADSTHSLDNESVHDRNSPARQADARARVSRDSDLPTTWVRPSALMAPPPRPGYVNRWIRFRSGNEEDRDNLDKMMSQGWRPLPKSKLRKDHVLTANLEGKYGQFVTKRGLILMELPEDLWNQRRDFYAVKQQKMTESIDRNLFREQDRRMPFMTPERRTTVTRRARRGRLEDNIPGDEE